MSESVTPSLPCALRGIYTDYFTFPLRDTKTKESSTICGTCWCLPEELRETSNTVSWCFFSGPRFEIETFCWGDLSK